MKVKAIDENLFLNKRKITIGDLASKKEIQEQLEPVVLYQSSNGDNGNITLNDMATNYKYIEVYFRDDNYIFDSKKLDVGNNVWYDLKIVQFDQNSGQIVIRGKNIQISDNQLKNGNYCAAVVKGSGNLLYWNNNIYIYKVLGYKE